MKNRILDGFIKAELQGNSIILISIHPSPQLIIKNPFLKNVNEEEVKAGSCFAHRVFTLNAVFEPVKIFLASIVTKST
jgi:hypothetical protein